MKFFSTIFSQTRTKTNIVIFFKTVVYKQDFFVLFTKSVEAYLSNKTGSGDSIAETCQ